MKKHILIIFTLQLILHFKSFSQQKDSLSNTIHVFVALCDNENQGIVPVPSKIGNGQDPKNNLYWGCKYGISTFFKNSTEWEFIEKQTVDSIIFLILIILGFNKKSNVKQKVSILISFLTWY